MELKFEQLLSIYLNKLDNIILRKHKGLISQEIADASILTNHF